MSEIKRIELEDPYWISTESVKTAIVGKTITAIRFNEDTLIIEFGDEYISLGVMGDCCSSSYFYDFYGVDKIIGKKVTGFSNIELDPTDLKAHDDDDDDVIKVYGYKITCEPNDDYFSTSATAVFSFRNSSNGYYGGSLENGVDYSETVPKIEKDTIL